MNQKKIMKKPKLSIYFILFHLSLCISLQASHHSLQASAEQLLLPYLYQHENDTEVFDALGRKTIYLLSESEDNGKRISYSYDPQTLLKIGVFIENEFGIIQRQFLQYDEEKRLIQILVDDGISRDISDMQGVTERHMAAFTYSKNESCKNLVEISEEKYFDPKSGNYQTTRLTLCCYDNQGLLLSKHIFHGDNSLAHATEFSYDSFGRLIKELDESGTGYEKEYDEQGLLLSETLIQNNTLLQTTRFSYDLANRLIAKQRTYPDGKEENHTYQYNEAGEKIAETDSYGNTTTFLYGSFSLSTIWQGAKNLASTFTGALVDFKDTASYSSFIQKKWDGLAEEFMGSRFLQFSGYYNHSIEKGCTPYGEEADDKIRVTLINGILNVRRDLDESLRLFSATHGNIPIHYVYRPTEGWTKDILASTLSKFGYTSSYAKLLAQTWKEMIEEMGGVGQGGKILHYAHSIGAADTYVARHLLTPEEQQMIHVIAIGSPTMIPKDCGFANVINYVSKRDGVCLLDPIGYASAYFNETSQVELIGSLWGIPLIDHTLYTESYGRIIKELGQQFIGTYR